MLIVVKIPPDNHLYRRVSDECFDAPSGKCTEGAFLLRLDRGETDLSVDWAERGNIHISCVDYRTKKKFKIAELLVQVPLDLGLAVDYTPRKHNTAHTSISGKDLFDEVERFIKASELADKSVMRFP